MPDRLSFDRVAPIYDETRGLPPRILSRILGVLVDELRGKRVLEVGVGTGRFAVPLQKSGIDVVGIDISHAMVELGLAKGLRNVVFADAVRLPFPARAFDVTTSNHVLHLVPDWRQPPGLHERKLADLLRPDVVMPVGPFPETLPADRAIVEIERRDYTSQWAVPEEIHRNAVRALRERWGGKELSWSTTYEITSWDASRLPEIAAAEGAQTS